MVLKAPPGANLRETLSLLDRAEALPRREVGDDNSVGRKAREGAKIVLRELRNRDHNIPGRNKRREKRPKHSRRVRTGFLRMSQGNHIMDRDNPRK